MLGFNYKKAVQAINFFAIKEGGTINKMKALKLIWLSDRLHLRMYSRSITNDVYFAMNFGPVASSTKDLAEKNALLADVEEAYRNQFIKSEGRYYIFSVADVNKRVFSKTDRQIMTKVYDSFGELNEFTLSHISHKYPEWKKWESKLKNQTGYSRFQMDYNDFFLNPADTDNDDLFKNDESSLFITKELFVENCQINTFKIS